MDRLYQAILIASILGLSWLGMQVVHEAGHVLVAWAGGETVYRVVLHPLAISRTDTSHDRHPLLVVWGGPVLGVLLPGPAHINLLEIKGVLQESSSIIGF
jgi:hypothetical protein